MDTKKLDYYEHTFITMLETVEFSLDKQENGLYKLIDERGAYLDDEEYELSDCETPSQIIERLDTFLNNYYFDDLERAAEEEFGFDLSGDNAPVTAEDWVQFLDEHEAFKTAYPHEYDVMDMIAHPDEVNLINLDNVVRCFYPEPAKFSEFLDNSDIYQATYVCFKEIVDPSIRRGEFKRGDCKVLFSRKSGAEDFTEVYYKNLLLCTISKQGENFVIKPSTTDVSQNDLQKVKAAIDDTYRYRYNPPYDICRRKTDIERD